TAENYQKTKGNNVRASLPESLPQFQQWLNHFIMALPVGHLLLYATEVIELQKHCSSPCPFK
ncbi:hypothetical protein P7K49_022423, partial [Saguinus oedipus]